MSGAAYKPLSLLVVEYKKGDLVGFLLAWTSVIPIFIPVCLLTLIVARRDLTTIFSFIGFLFTELSNFILKNLIKQPRPITDRESVGSFTKYGMPSDHSQVMFYFSSFFICLVVFRYAVTNNDFYQFLLKVVLVAGSFLTAILVAVSRIYLEYHTFQQVLVGSLLGVLMGSTWFFLVHNVFSNYFYHITTWKISEFLMIRDYTHIPNVLLFQYRSERNEANLRRKNKNK